MFLDVKHSKNAKIRKRKYCIVIPIFDKKKEKKINIRKIFREILILLLLKIHREKSFFKFNNPSCFVFVVF